MYEPLYLLHGNYFIIIIIKMCVTLNGPRTELLVLAGSRNEWMNLTGVGLSKDSVNICRHELHFTAKATL